MRHRIGDKTNHTFHNRSTTFLTKEIWPLIFKMGKERWGNSDLSQKSSEKFTDEIETALEKQHSGMFPRKKNIYGEIDRNLQAFSPVRKRRRRRLGEPFSWQQETSVCCRIFDRHARWYNITTKCQILLSKTDPDHVGQNSANSSVWSVWYDERVLHIHIYERLLKSLIRADDSRRECAKIVVIVGNEGESKRARDLINFSCPDLSRFEDG